MTDRDGMPISTWPVNFGVSLMRVPYLLCNACPVKINDLQVGNLRGSVGPWLDDACALAIGAHCGRNTNKHVVSSEIAMDIGSLLKLAGNGFESIGDFVFGPCSHFRMLMNQFVKRYPARN